MNANEWCRIVAYRAFDDVPHLILATNLAEDDFWVLDARLDEDRHEYSPIYTVHDAGHALDEATTRFAQHADEVELLPPQGCIPVSHVLFDETRREALRLTSAPIT